MKVKENIEKLEVLSEIYNDLADNSYNSKKELDVAKLKMQLLKKEMLLVTYMIENDIDSIRC